MNTIDFGLTAMDYRRHRAGFPDALFARLAAHQIGVAGQRVLDLGAGTGSLARGFARGACAVTGLDPSTALLDQARALDREAGLSVNYITGYAEDTGLPEGGFDIVSAGQCWHWFDRPRAAAEAWRLLRPGGCLVMAHFDWLPLPGTVADASERLILAHNPSWTGFGGAGGKSKWFADLAVQGFSAIESFSFDVPVQYSHEDWRGRIRASAGIGASLSDEAVAAFDVAHAEMLRDKFPQPLLATPHRVFAVFGRKGAL